MDAGLDNLISSASSSTSPDDGTALWWSMPKRPAGRTKFKETRHPVYRGVRRRGSAGRWVCEVRVPGKLGQRLWLGTQLTAEAAARAHDAAMLALGGSSVVCLNFSDSAWLLDMPPTLSDSDLAHALGAVAAFQCAEAANGIHVAPGDTILGSTCSASAPSFTGNAASSTMPSEATADGTFEVPAALGSDMFELDMSGEMDLVTWARIMPTSRRVCYWSRRRRQLPRMLGEQ